MEYQPKQIPITKRILDGDYITLFFGDNQKMAIDIKNNDFSMHFYTKERVKGCLFSTSYWRLRQSKIILIRDNIDNSKQIRSISVETWDSETAIHHIINCFLEEIEDDCLKSLSFKEKIILDLF